MSERAERLTTKLKKEFGSIPEWEAEFTQSCLQAGDSDWDITRKYHLTVHDYNKNRPLARVLHRMCKEEIGECQEITEEMIWKWFALDNWTDLQVKAKYRQEFDKAQPEVRRAKKLLAEMRRDLGDCHLVGDTHVREWMKHDLREDHIRRKYEDYMREARLANRAAVLRYRLEDEVPGNFAVSDAELLERCRDNPDDNALADAYSFKFDTDQGGTVGEDAGGVQEDTAEEGKSE
ncbi:uncharacterized protein J4E84_006359 [Alternaria hordeiaustralica]|uniref:uncharacterized protein n=1 Tax=Alternaria hordeiaustralica TaxID=1187925 RepID=UPI0020C55F24|nr:uncharacterized protein J4E84_006359 [Alternaria hordeiaustralica]KAI4684370.1 hypothetical protein J4E84_006359 [Alternaria hordeiaustralica]